MSQQRHSETIGDAIYTVEVDTSRPPRFCPARGSAQLRRDGKLIDSIEYESATERDLAYSTLLDRIPSTRDDQEWSLWSDNHAAAFWRGGPALWDVPLYLHGLSGPVARTMQAVARSAREAIMLIAEYVAKQIPDRGYRVGETAHYSHIRANPYPPSVDDVARVWAYGPLGYRYYDMRESYIGPQR